MEGMFRRVILVFMTVCGGSLAGMTMGGLFGRWAGQSAPDFFTHLMAFPGNNITLEPIGVATMLGAAGGTVLGGLLAVFSIMVAVVLTAIRARQTSRAA
jgi:hypothetical protein